jgi:hypothetical protein
MWIVAGADAAGTSAVIPGQAKGLSPEPMNTTLIVMVGLVPTIHVFLRAKRC